MNYYNEFDPKAAAWLRELIREGHIPLGRVDERSIVDVQPDELRDYTQCHFFAGIGGWSYALRLAAWPEDRPVWTGSCPCQPFSSAGQRKGTADERHLWPAWFRLIEKCRPARVFGEQVASKDALPWLDGVCTDLESAGYAATASDLCAAGVGSPNIRQRLFWVADAADLRRERDQLVSRGNREEEECGGLLQPARDRSRGFRLADLQDGARQRAKLRSDEGSYRRELDGGSGLADPQLNAGGSGWLAEQSRESSGAASAGAPAESGRCGVLGGLGNPDGPGPLARGQAAETDGHGRSAESDGDFGRPAHHHHHQGSQGRRLRSGCDGLELTPWASGTVLIPCADGKQRRIKPEIFPLAHGVSGRVGLLRGAGNAINPWLAAEFIQAVEEALSI